MRRPAAPHFVIGGSRFEVRGSVFPRFRSAVAAALGVCLGWFATSQVCAQPAPTSAQANALMQLMLSQPPVDINSPVTATATLDPPVVEAGETAVYRLTLNALESSVRWPQEIALPPGLKLTPSARGQILRQDINALRPLTALNFHVVAERPGFYMIPAFVLEVYGKPVLVRETPLEVAAKLEPSRERARRLLVKPARTNVFVGETLRVHVRLPSVISNLVETLTQLQFNGDGFLDDKMIFRQQNELLEIGGRMTTAWLVESSVTPIAAGRQTLSAQAFTGGRQFIGPIVFTGQINLLASQPQNVLLDSDPVTLEVRPLPPEETTSGFTGYIGNVSMETPQISTNSLRVGDAIRLLVTFRGDHRISRLAPPEAPRVAGWQIFPPMPAEPPFVGPVTNLRAAFAYTLIPMTEEVRQTPAIPFSVFDPEKAAYMDLTISAVNVTVSAEGLPVDWKPASLADEARPEQKPSLSALAPTPGKTIGSLVPIQMRSWFLPLQLAPALALLGLWSWDRRRRFLEAHPEVVRRRQARRALRREKRALRRAAASGDAPGFVARAVAALQIAAAPHFPAEPRALVCGEVLSLFDEPERTGSTGEVIRSFFTRDDSASFSPKRDDPMPLFALQPELEGILKRMEARL